MVYSENLGTMVVKGFTLKRVYIDITGKIPILLRDVNTIHGMMMI